VLMIVVSILHLHYLAVAQTDVLRTILESLMSSGRSFSSQLPVEDFYVYFFSAVGYSNVC
jgi:hypothetical protein